MYYHLIIEITENKRKKNIYLTNIENIEEIKTYAKKYINNSIFFVDGYKLTFEMINRFKIVSTERKTNEIANDVRASYSRSNFFVLVKNTDVLEMQKYITDMTTTILNGLDTEDQYVTDGTLNLGKYINDVVKKETKNQKGQTIINNGNVFYGSVSNSNVITGNYSTINYEKIDAFLDDVKKSIINEDLEESKKQELIEVVDDIKDSSQNKKKPSIIKNAIIGLKNMLMEFGCNVTTKLIEDKANGLW